MTDGTRGSFDGVVVGRLEGHFVVPSYQRGYRWGAVEVQRLLDDIRESEGETYYLQPIVVKRVGDAWELIDGQQRLTTLYLIFRYLRQHALPMAEARYHLEYATRPRSAEFLEEPTADGAGDNIDFFHIFEAWRAIAEWFESHGADKGLEAINLYKALSERVKVIWYEAPDDVEATALFRRLNVGRIPLTDAELVKALVLSKSRGDGGRTDRAHAIAAEWDSIERDLRVPELWAFLTGHAVEQPTHISLLFEIIAGAPAGRERAFHVFETLRARIVSDPEAFWNQVVDLHSLVLGWFDDRELFHKIGFLVATGVRLPHILGLADGAGRSEFVSRLDARIRSQLGLTRERLRELSYERSLDRVKLTNALLLLNVETIWRVEHSSERYSFKAHASGRWSLEHIHAQNAEGLRTAEQWMTWLELHREALADLPHVSAERRLELERRIDEVRADLTEERFHDVERELAGVFAPDGSASTEGDEHSISNLALLDSRVNSALSNSMFEVKRRAVLTWDRTGSYIPVATRNVFLKYYTRERAQQVHYWSLQDREAYLAEIERRLDPYLDTSDEPAEERAA